MKKRTFPALSGLLAGVEKYKYVLLVALVGAALLLLPDNGQWKGTGQGTQPELDLQATDGFDLNRMERRLSETLSKIEGAGEVSVLLTVRSSSRRVLAVDEQAGDRELRSETVVISKGSGTQEPVLLEQQYPDYQGALIVCSGAEDAVVRLKLTEAVAALTGLGTDRISICKGK